jgi:uncharacterized protein YjbI with pentapeptide repeats
VRFLAQLQGAHLGNSDLRSAKFKCENGHEKCAQLQGAHFVYAQLQGADLMGAHLHDGAQPAPIFPPRSSAAIKPLMP